MSAVINILDFMLFVVSFLDQFRSTQPFLHVVQLTYNFFSLPRPLPPRFFLPPLPAAFPVFLAAVSPAVAFRVGVALGPAGFQRDALDG